MRPSFLIGAVVVAIGLILLFQYWPGSEDAEPVQVPTAVEPAIIAPPSVSEFERAPPVERPVQTELELEPELPEEILVEITTQFE